MAIITIRIEGLLECPDGRRSAALSYNDGPHTAVAALQFNNDDDVDVDDRDGDDVGDGDGNGDDDSSHTMLLLPFKSIISPSSAIASAANFKLRPKPFVASLVLP